MFVTLPECVGFLKLYAAFDVLRRFIYDGPCGTSAENHVNTNWFLLFVRFVTTRIVHYIEVIIVAVGHNFITIIDM